MTEWDIHFYLKRNSYYISCTAMNVKQNWRIWLKIWFFRFWCNIDTFPGCINLIRFLNKTYNRCNYVSKATVEMLIFIVVNYSCDYGTTCSIINDLITLHQKSICPIQFELNETRIGTWCTVNFIDSMSFSSLSSFDLDYM